MQHRLDCGIWITEIFTASYQSFSGCRFQSFSQLETDLATPNFQYFNILLTDFQWDNFSWVNLSWATLRRLRTGLLHFSNHTNIQVHAGFVRVWRFIRLIISSPLYWPICD